MKRKEKLVYNIILLVLVLIFLVAGLKLVGIFNEYRVGENEYDGLEEYVSMEETKEVPKDEGEVANPTEGNAEEPMTEAETPPELKISYVDFTELKKINPDIVAWIYIPGLDINYPVVHGSDNKYYLTHTATKKKNKNGAIFLAVENKPDFTDDNTIIYGHNMKNNTMFANLHDYKNPNTSRMYPYVYIYTSEYSMIYQIFSSYTGASNGSAYTYKVGNPADKPALFKELQALSEHPYALDFTEEDTIITLSTCLDNNSPDWRYLVHAKLIAKEEANSDAKFELQD